jgi:hypothetical protein
VCYEDLRVPSKEKGTSNSDARMLKDWFVVTAHVLSDWGPVYIAPREPIPGIRRREINEGDVCSMKCAATFLKMFAAKLDPPEADVEPL